MRGRYGHWFGSGFWLGPNVVWIAITVAAILVAVGVTWWIMRRKKMRAQTAGLTETQRQTLGDFETQVAALIVQHGGEVDQTAIVAALGLPAQLVAEKLFELEHAGVIERRWTVDRMTYAIRRSAA